NVLLADDPQLLPVTVVGEGLDHVRARVHELAVEFLDHVRVGQDHLGDERPGLEVPTPLAFEQVALGADHGTALEQYGQIRHVASSVGVLPSVQYWWLRGPGGRLMP